MIFHIALSQHTRPWGVRERSRAKGDEALLRDRVSSKSADVNSCQVRFRRICDDCDDEEEDKYRVILILDHIFDHLIDAVNTCVCPVDSLVNAVDVTLYIAHYVQKLMERMSANFAKGT